MWPFNRLSQRIREWQSAKVEDGSTHEAESEELCPQWEESDDRRKRWEKLFASFLAAEDRILASGRTSESLKRCSAVLKQFVRQARPLLENATEEDWSFLEESLQDKHRKLLVAEVFAKDTLLPSRLMEPFIWAAVYEIDPDDNRWFVHPCVAAVGRRFVNESLLNIIESGSNFEKAGAANALYWASLGLAFNDAGNKPMTIENATPESREAFLELNDIWQRKRELFLTEFVANTNLDVRRSLIASLSLDESEYSDDFKPLVKQAIDIGRMHEDEYIRSRVKYEMGENDLIYPLPNREPTDARAAINQDYKSRQ